MLTVIFKRFCLYRVIQKRKLELHEHIFSCRLCMICLKFLPVFLDKVLIWGLSFLQAQLSVTECPETDSLLKWHHTNLRLVRHCTFFPFLKDHTAGFCPQTPCSISFSLQHSKSWRRIFSLPGICCCLLFSHEICNCFQRLDQPSLCIFSQGFISYQFFPAAE